MKKLFLTGITVLIVLSSFGCYPLDGRVAADAETTPETRHKDNQTTSEGRTANSDIKYINSENGKNEALSRAIIQALGLSSNEAKKTRYYYNYIDLNDDNYQEVFVQLVGPFTGGTGGDTGLIFLQKNNDFELLQKLTLIRNPIIISNGKTNGWHDIIIEMSGGGIKAHYVRMSYDGRRYPNPSAAEDLPKDYPLKGIGIINDNIAEDFRSGKGLYLN